MYLKPETGQQAKKFWVFGIVVSRYHLYDKSIDFVDQRVWNTENTAFSLAII